MDYLVHILVILSIQIILVASLDLVAGVTGMLSVAHAAFLGLGAYTAGLITVRLGLPLPVDLIAAALLTAVTGWVMGGWVVRLKADYLVLGTFAIQITAFELFLNWSEVTGGAQGLRGVPRPDLPGLGPMNTPGQFLVLAGPIAIVAFWLCFRISASPFGRLLRLVRDDEVLAMSLGKNSLAAKRVVFSFSAALAGLAGALEARYLGFVQPFEFGAIASILVLAAVIVGGAGTRLGPVAGAALFVLMPELLRQLGLPGPAIGNLRQVAFGALLIVCLLWRPEGLAGRSSRGDSR